MNSKRLILYSRVVVLPPIFCHSYQFVIVGFFPLTRAPVAELIRFVRVCVYIGNVGRSEVQKVSTCQIVGAKFNGVVIKF